METKVLLSICSLLTDANPNDPLVKMQPADAYRELAKRGPLNPAFDSAFVTASTSLGEAKVGVGMYDSDYGDESMNIGVMMPISGFDFNITYSEHEEQSGHDPSGYMFGIGKSLGFGDYTLEYHHADLTGSESGEVDTVRLGYSISFGPGYIPLVIN